MKPKTAIAPRMIKVNPIQESAFPIQANKNMLPIVQTISIPITNQTAMGTICFVQPTTPTYNPMPNTHNPLEL